MPRKSIGEVCVELEEEGHDVVAAFTGCECRGWGVCGRPYWCATELGEGVVGGVAGGVAEGHVRRGGGSEGVAVAVVVGHG